MADTTSASELTTIARKHFPRRSCELTWLPFVKDVKVSPRRKTRKFWQVPEVHCYTTANIIGNQYAADWIQYIKENPGMVGSGFMGWIVKEMYPPANGEDKSHGIAAGFWALIEQALINSNLDHYTTAERTAERLKKDYLSEQE